MGRDSTSYCDDCKVRQYNGHGSSTTWLDSCESVEEFDKEAKKVGRGDSISDKNTNVRAFLVAHAGHRIGFTSSDWDEYDDPKREKPPNGYEWVEGPVNMT